MQTKYKDIMHLNRPNSKKHPRMSLYNRAAQFAPFMAVAGHSESVDEAARFTDEKIVLHEEIMEILNNKLMHLVSLNPIPSAKFIYFQKDLYKEGGMYKEKTGIIKRIDDVYRQIEFLDKKRICIEDLIDIQMIK